MKRLWLCFLGIVMLPSASYSQESAAPVKSHPYYNPYYPLAVGNSWIYKCAFKGRLSEDVVEEKITHMVKLNGYRIYTRKTEGTGTHYKVPWVDYLRIDRKGEIVKSYQRSFNPFTTHTLISTTQPKLGDKIGIGDSGILVVKHITHFDADASPFFALDPLDKKYNGVEVVSAMFDDPYDTNPNPDRTNGYGYSKDIGKVWFGDSLNTGCNLVSHKVKPAPTR